MSCRNCARALCEAGVMVCAWVLSKAARLRVKQRRARYNGAARSSCLGGTCMQNLGKLIVVAGLIGILAVAAATPSQARWYRHRGARGIIPPGGVIGWSVPFSYKYVGASYFSNS